jgi:hypothetical protein
MIQKVFYQIPLVHQLIVDSGSENVYVEEMRGCQNILTPPEGFSSTNENEKDSARWSVSVDLFLV